MSGPMLPISETTGQQLHELAKQTGQSVEAILEQALEDYRRKVFFQGLTADFAALKADPEAWAEELAERQLWESTLMDGQDPSERWTEDGRILPTDGEPG